MNDRYDGHINEQDEAEGRNVEPRTEAGQRFIRENGTSHIVLIAAIEAEAAAQASAAPPDAGLRYTEEVSAVFRILGNHEGMGCCDPKTLEHVAQSIRALADKL